VWALGSEEDCCTKLVPDTDESLKLLGAVNAAFSASARILHLSNLISEKFTNVTGQNYLAAVHWRDDEDFVRSSHGLDLNAMDRAICDALASMTSTIITIKLPLHVIILGDILPRKLQELRHRMVGTCPMVEKKLELHTKTSLLPDNYKLKSGYLGGDDIKGQVCSLAA
jgi:hypothetical protein